MPFAVNQKDKLKPIEEKTKTINQEQALPIKVECCLSIKSNMVLIPLCDKM